MATRLNPVLERLLKDRRISHSRISKAMVQKELSAAETDLKEARDSLKRGKTKWGTVQAYYSTFHAARAVLYSKGYREKSHRGLLNALRELARKELSAELLDDFEDAMGMREAADYGNVFSEEGAESTLATASEFLEQAKTILKGKKFDSA